MQKNDLLSFCRTFFADDTANAEFILARKRGID